MRFLIAFFALCSLASAENIFVSPGNPFAVCHCYDGSPCICGEDCQCVGCPFHNKAFPAHRALVFTASWCGPCKPAAEARKKAGLKEGIDYELVDIDKKPDVMRKYGVKNIPYLILLDGEKEHLRLLGATGQAEEIQKWMCGIKENGPKFQSAPLPLKDSRIETPTRFSYQMPVMYRPSYYYTPPTFSQRFYGDGSQLCPNCR
jgi:thiol-disulfide isomerase/thioredoxin